MDIEATIRGLLGELLAEQDADGAALRAVAKASGALPLYVDRALIIGIRPDGEVLQHGWDAGDLSPEPAGEPLRTMAFALGARRYEALRSMLPDRPQAAVDCERCCGTGRAFAQDAPPGIPCTACLCLGWVAKASESR